MKFKTSFSLEEVNRCLLCNEAKCSKACPAMLDPAGILRSIKFDNLNGAATRIKNTDACVGCSAPCEQSCCLKNPIDIRNILLSLKEDAKSWEDIPESDVDLSCDFLGVHFENPFLLSSSVVASSYEKIARAFDMGWGGACYKTICDFIPEETSPRYSALSDSQEFYGFKNIEQLSGYSLQEDLDIIRRLKRDYPSKVMIISIMGRNEEEWERLARLSQEVGADIIECNFSCPNMEQNGLGSDIGQDINAVAKCTRAARRGCTIPLLAKLTPNVADMRPFAKVALENGADGIAAINTIKSLMGMNLDTYACEPSVRGTSSVGGYSGKAVKPIALRFICEMASDPELKGVAISAMGGIEIWKDAVEFILLGANHVQITTAVMQYGLRIIDDLKEGLSWYMREKALTKVSQLQGLGIHNVKELDNLDRQTKLLPHFQRKNCVGCQRCFISCRDGGHEAIQMVNGKPIMNPNKCVGCHLCVLVCPTSDISPYGKRVPVKKD